MQEVSAAASRDPPSQSQINGSKTSVDGRKNRVGRPFGPLLTSWSHCDQKSFLLERGPCVLVPASYPICTYFSPQEVPDHDLLRTTFASSPSYDRFAALENCNDRVEGFE